MTKKTTKKTTKTAPKKTTKKKASAATPHLAAPEVAIAPVKRPRGRPRKSPKIVPDDKPLSKPEDFVPVLHIDDEFQKGLAEAFEKAVEEQKLGTPEQRLAKRIKANIQDLARDKRRALTEEESYTLASFIIDNYASEMEKVDGEKVLEELENLQKPTTPLEEKPEFKFRARPVSAEESFEEIRAKAKKLVEENKGKPLQEILALVGNVVTPDTVVEAAALSTNNPAAVAEVVAKMDLSFERAMDEAAKTEEPAAVAAVETSPETEAGLQEVINNYGLATPPLSLPWYKRWWLAILRFFS